MLVRKMHPDEIELAQSIFAHSIQYDSVLIKGVWWVLRHYGVTPNGNIYVNKKDWCHNYASQSIEKQAWFLHECTHIWQYQQGKRVLLRALFDRRYGYRLLHEKFFHQYGIEQQAQMVEDYFLALKRGETCTDLEACIQQIRQT